MNAEEKRQLIIANLDRARGVIDGVLYQLGWDTTCAARASNEEALLKLRDLGDEIAAYRVIFERAPIEKLFRL